MIAQLPWSGTMLGDGEKDKSETALTLSYGPGIHVFSPLLVMEPMTCSWAQR